MSVPELPSSTHFPDEITLSLIATGVIRLFDGLERGQPMAYPYPPALQRGLDRLVASRLISGQKPPHGVTDLLAWCRAPIAQWGLALPPDAIGEADTLLSGPAPTDVCDSWACTNPDVEADLTERQFMQKVFEICRTSASEEIYRQFRLTLIRQRSLNELEFQQLLAEPGFEALSSEIHQAYPSVPTTCLLDGEYWCCARCGNLLQRDEHRKPYCENDRCRRHNAQGVGRRIPAREGVHWLSRPLRRFVADPGLTELRLAEKIEDLGLHVELWPAFDRYDLRVSFSSGEAWAVDVKDWANPFLLARSVMPIPSTPPWTRAFYVFPDERYKRQRDYARAFNHHTNSANAPGMFEGQLMNEIKKRLGDS